MIFIFVGAFSLVCRECFQFDSLFSECHNALSTHFCTWLNVRSICDPDTDGTMRAEHEGTNKAMDTLFWPPVRANQLALQRCSFDPMLWSKNKKLGDRDKSQGCVNKTAWGTCMLNLSGLDLWRMIVTSNQLLQWLDVCKHWLHLHTVHLYILHHFRFLNDINSKIKKLCGRAHVPFIFFLTIFKAL